MLNDSKIIVQGKYHSNIYNKCTVQVYVYVHSPMSTVVPPRSIHNANKTNTPDITAQIPNFTNPHAMSLYFDAVAILTAPSSGGSFKSRIYSARNLRASPAQIYALTTEAAKWDTVLADVIDKSGILTLERKVN